MYFDIKSIGEGSVKDVDLQKGIVKGYFSWFGNVDSDGDVISRGAFNKSLSESNRQKHLYSHDPMQPLSSVRSGKLLLKEDNNGLYYESEISKTSWGMDVLKLYEDQVIDENSIGFRTVKSLERKGFREIIEVKLFEGSSLAFGANEEARNVKGLTEDFLEKKMSSVNKAIRNGTFENEELFDQLEIFHEQLQSIFVYLKGTQPVAKTTVEPLLDEGSRKELEALTKLLEQPPKADLDAIEKRHREQSLAGRVLKGRFKKPNY